MPKRKGRRANGEGSVYVRSDGRWCAAVSYVNDQGKARQRTVYTKTQKEAIAAKRELLKQRDAGKLLTPTKETVGEFLMHWLTTVVPTKRRAATQHVYRSIVTQHLIPKLGHIRLDRLTPEHFERVQHEALKTLSPRTVTVMRAVFSAAMSVATERGRVTQNIVDLVDGPRIEPYSATVLTDEEAHRLLAAAAGDRFEAGYALALYLGPRIGELLGLRWQDIDWKKKRIHIRVQLEHPGPPPVLSEPKTKKSHRTLPLIAELATVLKRHQVRQMEERLAYKGVMPDYDLIFTRANGEAYSEATVRVSFQRLLTSAGLPPMRFHDLRHACATLLASAGVSQRLSMAILGHASLQVNQLVYTHIIEEDITGAVESLAQAITDADTTEHLLATANTTVNDRETA